LIGYSHIKDGATSWRINQKGLFPLSPPNKIVSNKIELARLMKNTNTLYVRWESNFDNLESSFWWHIICDKILNIEELSKNTRYQVRRGKKNFYTELLSRDTILDEGFKVYKNSFARYKTHENEFDKNQFKVAILNMSEHTEFFGARSIETRELLAFSENYIEDNICFCNSIWFDPSAFKQKISYLFFYDLINLYLKEKEFKYISDGTRSISHNTNIHEFLESKFGFRKAYASLNVIYHPLLNIFVKFFYPLRKCLEFLPFKIFKIASIFLKQEEIHRKCINSNVMYKR
jgi:hypothetical protein